MTKSTNTPLIPTLLLLIAAATPSASAQTASSFEQLVLLVESGDRVTVTDSAGREQTGKIIDLSPSTLALRIDGARHDFRAESVRTIRQWRPDSLRQGALIGLAAGAITAMALTFPHGDFSGSGKAAFLGLFAAAGTGMGVGIDALIPTRKVIFRSPAATRRLTVAPLLASNRQGLAVSIGF